MTKSSFSIDSALKLISFSASVLIFLSILKSYIFYATFGISITNYISFSEAILLFLNEVAILLLYYLLLATGLCLTYGIFYVFRRQTRPIDIFIPDRTSPFIHKLFSAALMLYPIFYLFFAIVKNNRDHSSVKSFLFWLISLSIAEVLILIATINYWKKVRETKQAIRKSVFTYILLASALFFYIWSLDRQLFLFHRNRINKSVIGWVKDKEKPVTLTNDTIQYLGSTGKYVFCYDQVSKKSIIIDAAQFTRIEFGSYSHLPGFSAFDLLFH